MSRKKISNETRLKMSLARKGRKFTGGWKLSNETRLKQSIASKGKPKSPEHIKNLSNVLNGKPKKKWSEESKLQLSLSRSGEKCYWLWKGGITPKNKQARKGIEWKKWRSSVFTRDNWTCQTCGIRGGNLEAHHIKSFAEYSELRYKLDNGITLCRECHKLTDNFGGRKTNQNKN